MDFWIKAAQLLLSLSILVVLHEFGHFIPARLFKTRVEKFYLFFNWKFSLFKKKIGDTEWGIGWIPLGGYVKIAGMIDESMDKDQMAKDPEPWEFRSKPAWQRLIIMIGGVTVNLVLGFLIYMMVLFFWGQDHVSIKDLKNGFQVMPIAQKLGFENGDKIISVDGESLVNTIDINRHLMLRNVQEVKVKHQGGEIETIKIPEDFGQTMWKENMMQPFVPRVHLLTHNISEKSTAYKAGLRDNDSVVAVNGKSFVFYDEFFDLMNDSIGNELTLDYIRKGKLYSIDVKKDSLGKIGVGPDFNYNSAYTRSTKTFSFGEAVTGGFSFGYWTLHDYVAQFKYVFTKKGATSMGGFGALGNLFPGQWDWKIFWLNTALISIILAFMNILPIPALDGGHVVFLLYEMITGKEAPQKVLEYAQYIGFILILGLVIYANGNDIYRAIFGG
jgi:regulator of sigma E protease